MTTLFLFKPFIALLLAVSCCSLLGVFVLWKRVTYFGDCFSHASLLGVVLALILGFNQSLVLIIFAVLFGIIVAFLSRNFGAQNFSRNTLIAIFSYSLLALAIMLAKSGKEVGIEDYLFGYTSSVSNGEIITLAILCVITILYSAKFFQKILLSDISPDLAQVEGIKTIWLDCSFLVLLAIAIALSVPIIGAFLVTALLILPASIARVGSSSAKNMLILSVVVGIAAALFAIAASHFKHLALTPTLVLALGVIFVTSVMINQLLYTLKIK